MKRDKKEEKKKPTDGTIGQFPLPMERVTDILLLPYSNEKVGLIKKPFYYGRILNCNDGSSLARH